MKKLVRNAHCLLRYIAYAPSATAIILIRSAVRFDVFLNPAINEVTAGFVRPAFELRRRRLRRRLALPSITAASRARAR